MPDINMDRVRKNGMALGLMNSDLQDRLELVMAAIKQNGLALMYASRRLRNDIEVIMVAENNRPEALLYAGAEAIAKRNKLIKDMIDVHIPVTVLQTMIVQYLSEK
jgi:hypothetical protein